MNDAVLIDLATKVDPGIEVVFIDTGYHFPETLETVETVRRRYGLNLRIMTVPHHDEELWRVDPENCCSAVKVGQLDRALAGKAAWMSGLRRDEADTRGQAPIVARDLRGLVKVNPLATWTDHDVDGYIDDHDVPVNPLHAAGLPVDRLRALHPPAHRPQRPPLGTLGRPATRRSAACTSEGRSAAWRPPRADRARTAGCKDARDPSTSAVGDGGCRRTRSSATGRSTCSPATELGSHLDYFWRLRDDARTSCLRLASFSRLDLLRPTRHGSVRRRRPATPSRRWEEWTEDLGAVLDAAGLDAGRRHRGRSTPSRSRCCTPRRTPTRCDVAHPARARPLATCVDGDYPIGVADAKTSTALIAFVREGWGEGGRRARRQPLVRGRSGVPSVPVPHPPAPPRPRRSAATQYDYILRERRS